MASDRVATRDRQRPGPLLCQRTREVIRGTGQHDVGRVVLRQPHGPGSTVHVSSVRAYTGVRDRPPQSSGKGLAPAGTQLGKSRRRRPDSCDLSRWAASDAPATRRPERRPAARVLGSDCAAGRAAACAGSRAGAGAWANAAGGADRGRRSDRPRRRRRLSARSGGALEDVAARWGRRVQQLADRARRSVPVSFRCRPCGFAAVPADRARSGHAEAEAPCSRHDSSRELGVHPPDGQGARRRGSPPTAAKGSSPNSGRSRPLSATVVTQGLGKVDLPVT